VPVHTDPESELELNVSASLQGVNYDLEYQINPVAKRFCGLDESTGYQPFVHWSVPKEMASEDSEPVDLQHQEPRPVNLQQPINKRVSLVLSKCISVLQWEEGFSMPVRAKTKKL